eukprot:CAMPEP_0119272868 /NCGR_PEP_ID=MMETSP1329-20130426/9122_1 /TAXON_ID=114041 /ORGANISM="Genus nov. species nov., Strain RCC1024" /LENGTH=66 /DNA_ID=CAMNT_0007272979 /DNA_START=156 /DNA_END=356 /DNA_ORIENTATION=-
MDSPRRLETVLPRRASRGQHLSMNVKRPALIDGRAAGRARSNGCIDAKSPDDILILRSYRAALSKE